mgnify:CR=1 FL=1
MNKFIKVALVGAVLATLTACTGHIENRDKNCSYDYLLHPAISISKIIGLTPSELSEGVFVSAFFSKISFTTIKCWQYFHARSAISSLHRRDLG